jgi:hypothetical protein
MIERLIAFARRLDEDAEILAQSVLADHLLEILGTERLFGAALLGPLSEAELSSLVSSIFFSTQNALPSARQSTQCHPNQFFETRFRRCFGERSIDDPLRLVPGIAEVHQRRHEFFARLDCRE